MRMGGWRNKLETRNYVNLFYLFESAPPFAVVRVSMPYTLPSCAQSRLNMRIQVAKSLVPLAPRDADRGEADVPASYLLCWGELDCYSCCLRLPHTYLLRLLQLHPAQ